MKKLIIIKLTLFLLIFLNLPPLSVSAQTTASTAPSLSMSPQTTAPSPDNLFPNANMRWVDSVFNTLSVDEKIGQLMMPRGNYSYEYDTARFNKIVRDYHVGGFVGFALGTLST